MGKVAQRSGNRYKVEYEVGKGTSYAWFPVSVLTSATRAEEIKRQAKAKRKVARESHLNEKIKIDTSVKKKNFEENDELVINGKIFTNTHQSEKKKSAAKYNMTKNNIVKRKKEDKHKPLCSYLQKQLKKHLKMADVRGNGNCFFRAIAHQLCYNESHHKQIRQSAVKEVIENPERILLLSELINTLQVYRRVENAQITLQYRQPQTLLVSALKLNLIQDISTSFLVILVMFIMWQQNFKNHLLQHHGV